ncbi:MAG: ATP-grasp domain-containing protein [Oligoflexia bacterium]|nr:ATP-grasp domain-containing protein [Oligoflexia bacterium]
MIQNTKIKRVLIANRGEIARRIQRACKTLNIESVCIASEADRGSLFAREAEKLVVIGPAAAKDSYLAADKVVKAAVESGCDAVHPGYGFLSENADFARKVQAAGLRFIGPEPASIEALGSKTEARKLAAARGVPITLGAPAGLSDAELVRRAEEIGFPVIVKAVAGGGGRGMRIVENCAELMAALPLARAEALKNFANEAVYFEQYIHQPRHVEVQIFGDSHGTILHFGTRDCSTQRRHQKLVEEAPAPFLSPALRAAIEHAAVEAACSVHYSNAGTAEFLVKDEKFYFLEMNTRIQVEHPVTEAVTGVDLVELQLRVAQGEALPLKQEQVKFRGHAIEFRIYAEDPATKFSPDKGRIQELVRPQAAYLREDYGFVQGDDVTLFYDAMLSKLIVSGPTRQETIARAYAALRAYKLSGIKSTLPFHRWLLLNSPFASGPLDIGYLDRNFSAECLKELAVSEVSDPRHKAPVAGAEFRERLDYLSQNFNVRYEIEVRHLREGHFLATPINESGERGRIRFSRRSNGFNAVVASLIEEVLERVEPAQIFGKELPAPTGSNLL